MNIVYYQEEPPETYAKSIFLAGPSPRSHYVQSWRPEAIQLLKKQGYDGVVFVPEYNPEKEVVEQEYAETVEWEDKNLNRADCILFWIPRDMTTLPGLTTNHEFGFWQNSGKVVLGCPPKAEHVRYQQYYAAKNGVPQAISLKETVANAIKMVGGGIERTGGERDIPLHVYRQSSFHAWLESHKDSGNRIEWAKVKWVHTTKTGFVFLWVVHAGVWMLLSFLCGNSGPR